MMTWHGTRTAQSLDAVAAGEIVTETLGNCRSRHSRSAAESAVDHAGPDLRYSAGRQYEIEVAVRFGL